MADGADSEQKEGVPELIGELTAQGVTVSMVSIGRGPDTPWLQPVSYTHLDVYKRQSIRCSSESARNGGAPVSGW